MPVTAEAVCAAFGLPERGATITVHTHVTWRLTTKSAEFLAKRIPEAWATEIGAAMALEGAARAAGIPVPSPVVPVHPVVGCAARLPDGTLVRVSEWVDGRPIEAGDDLADWLGKTVARLNTLRPRAAAEPVVYGIHPPESWAAWQAEGERQARPWAAMLARRRNDVAEATRWVKSAFERAGDYVETHRDLEPWNVLVTPQGPVIVDWDGAGGDSAGLVAAHAAYAFGGGHGPRTDRALAAYVAHGGRLPSPEDRFARRVGLMLSRLAERINWTLGEGDPSPFPIEELDRTAGDRLRDLPAFVADLREPR
ncbi:Predicted kinase, aminoglycoside phosphotransferase (APT) family [Asanoa hainanensis]|uniref:Predicted kinase, aminoglycoside phosphotransferase (APT) family n=1 Tax=Asanoa hainanensis TaxID=560556 RepID=A0A239PEL5_9ACTN|nr:phosphotransferase [Asanoa hainanensis]SNT65315.1 Predicted kinase, aminoglycoside phosphotransferase (APT) family [Asanoa hainanensis]